LIGPVTTNQDEPLDPAAYRHQLQLLKSLHCSRPVLHEGLNHFIKCLSVNLSGCDLQMTVYLAGKTEGIDSSEIQIKSSVHKGASDGPATEN
jgi:hypothetical protein